MKIARVRWTTYRVPFRTPYVTAHGAASVREGLLVELASDTGLVGLGEAAPSPEGRGAANAPAPAGGGAGDHGDGPGPRPYPQAAAPRRPAPLSRGDRGRDGRRRPGCRYHEHRGRQRDGGGAGHRGARGPG